MFALRAFPYVLVVIKSRLDVEIRTAAIAIPVDVWESVAHPRPLFTLRSLEVYPSFEYSAC